MFDFINQIGVFGMPLIIIALIILFLTVKYSMKLWSNNTNKNIDINSILYLGVFALSLGLFSHYLGLYQATGIMAQLRPEQIAAGYGQSLLALLYGFTIFFLSAICWFGLRLKVRRLKLHPAAE